MKFPLLFTIHALTPLFFIQIRDLFQRLKFSAAWTLAKLKRFDIGLKVFIFDVFEPNRKNWDLVDRDCLC
jgi:hypothetical protein